eukprot:symbB.v1.2.033236.t1/scaffold4102.1/size44650/2
MVYFECGKCNETVKKPKLAKHLMSCRAEYVFAWNEWECHTSCVSEAQKYQGNLYQAKESSNKGQLKQDAWVENVRQAISKEGAPIPEPERSLLEKLLGFDNIPRKQKAFTNFVKNSLKIWDDRKIEAMWKIIGAANAKKEEPNGSGKPDIQPEAKPEAKKANGKVWPGWKRAVDQELEANGGEMPWKRLCVRLADRYRETENRGSDDLELLALSNIPEEYCSFDAPTVTLKS